MNFCYDNDADALYIEITDSPVAGTRQFGPGTMVDIDQYGAVVGIEVLGPARDWPLEEIKASFRLNDDDTTILDSLWGQDPPRRYPFTKPLEIVA